MRHLRVDDAASGQRLDNFLMRLWKGVPKTHVYRVIRSGEVRINKGRAAAATRLESGDVLRLPPVRTAARAASEVAEARQFPVLYEDEHLLAIDKPAGTAVHGGSGVSFGVIEQLRAARPAARVLELVHRLDKATSGVLLLAKKRSALTGLAEQFRGRETGKVYLALVEGVWPKQHQVIDVPLYRYLDAQGERRVRRAESDDPGRRSITLVRLVRAYAAFSLLEVTLKTGRTHQIRVHLQGEGHAIVGDDKYGERALNRALARGEPLAGRGGTSRFARMFLHAARLSFAHPASGERVEIGSPLPADCAAFLDTLEP